MLQMRHQDAMTASALMLRSHGLGMLRRLQVLYGVVHQGLRPDPPKRQPARRRIET